MDVARAIAHPHHVPGLREIGGDRVVTLDLAMVRIVSTKRALDGMSGRHHGAIREARFKRKGGSVSSPGRLPRSMNYDDSRLDDRRVLELSRRPPEILLPGARLNHDVKCFAVGHFRMSSPHSAMSRRTV